MNVSDMRDQFIWKLAEELENISAQIATLSFIAKPNVTDVNGLKMGVGIFDSYIMGITDHIERIVEECKNLPDENQPEKKEESDHERKEALLQHLPVLRSTP